MTCGIEETRTGYTDRNIHIQQESLEPIEPGELTETGEQSATIRQQMDERRAAARRKGPQPKYGVTMKGTTTIRFPQEQWAWLGKKAGPGGDRSDVIRSLVEDAMQGAEQPKSPSE